ncbi:hypothetical protein BJX96DRAFT_43247 [Aspergillus floccosus]
MFLGFFDDASYAFQQQADDEADGQHKAAAHCSVCGEAWDRKSRFVCKTCPEIDLCSSCMTRYPRGVKVRACRSHIFFEVLPRPDLNKHASNGRVPHDVQEWLGRLLVRFGESPHHKPGESLTRDEPAPWIAGTAQNMPDLARSITLMAAVLFLIPSVYFLLGSI